MSIGIYALINQTNGKRYIGQSRDLNKRKITHLWLLNSNRHFNIHLQRAWNLGDRFDFEIIEECSKDELNDRERYWIKKYNSLVDGYNLCEGGEATDGYRFTEEQKKKISESRKGYKCSEEMVRKRIMARQEHIKNDKEFAEYMAEVWKRQADHFKGWNKGIPCPEEKKKMLSEKMKGRLVSEEHKEKLRELYSGEKSLSAKLHKSDVIEIRYRFLCGERQKDIIRDYPNVTPQTIYDIVRNRRWRSVPNTLEELEELWNQEKLAQDR